MRKKDVIRVYYGSKLKKAGPESAKLGWESEEAQNLRFEALSQNVDLNGKSLLDVGCGLGSLYSYLREKNINAKYSGVDILEEMVLCSKAKYPEAEFFCEDIFKSKFSESNRFDVIYSSGIFNLNLVNNMEFLEKALQKFVSMADHAVVFNLLCDRSDNKEREYFYYNEMDVEKIILHLPVKLSKTVFIDSYLRNDFTVVLFM